MKLNLRLLGWFNWVLLSLLRTYQRMTLNLLLEAYLLIKLQGTTKCRRESWSRDSCPITAPVIAELINNSFQQSTFPDEWKLAEVVPIPKEGDPKVPANNRPISLLPILSKVIETLAKKQFSDFLTRNNKLSIHQSGNKKHNSTETALVYVTDQLLKAVDEKTVVSPLV